VFVKEQDGTKAFLRFFAIFTRRPDAAVPFIFGLAWRGRQMIQKPIRREHDLGPETAP